MYQPALASQATTAAITTARWLIPANVTASLPISPDSVARNGHGNKFAGARLCFSQGREMSLQESAREPIRAHRERTQLAPGTAKLIRKAGLTYVTTDALKIRRLRHGSGFRYLN